MNPAKWFSYILLFLFTFLGSSFGVAVEIATVDTDATHIIKDGQFLVSKKKIFALGFFGFSDSSTRRYVGIWYNNIPELTVVWVANRNEPLKDNSGTLAIDRHGNIIIYSMAQNISLWSIDVSVLNEPLVELLDTGNLIVVQRQTQKILWQSFDYPTHTMLPYLKIRFDRRSGFSTALTSWKAQDDPGTGNFTARMDLTGYPQMVLYKGNVPWWRIGSWMGKRWSGVPEMTMNYFCNVSYIDNADEVSIMDGVTVDTMLMRMAVDESGFFRRYMWKEQDRKWIEYFTAPTEWCDNYDRCGPNTNCDASIPDQFQCRCLPGFEPKSPRDWSLRDASAGCIRKAENSTCQRGEGIVKVPRVKVPDTSTARGNKSMSLKACGEACLKDCNCMAYTSADETTKMGCITWFGDMIDTRTYANTGQDLYVRVDAVVLAQYARSKHRSETKLVAIIVAFAVATLLVIASIAYFKEKWRKRRERSEKDYFKDSPTFRELDGSKRSLDLPVFDLNAIAKATDNFSFNNKLGQGGFGSVYKGKLKSGEEIAVKRLAKNSGQGVEEFKNEVALIAKLQHINLVRILGYCVQHEEKMLVYEYLPNRSLDTFIFDENKRKLLDWTKRFEIILGIARGILYLHQDSRLKIIHRDLKASNVLLDVDFNPKLQILAWQENLEKTKFKQIQIGLLEHKYAMEGLFSVKSDVYSFGVLLLEIITGRKNSSYSENSSHLNLVGHVWELWNVNKALEIIDSNLGDVSSHANEILKCIQIGLLCIQEESTDRPAMCTVIFMLGNEVALHPPKKPAFISKRKYNIGDPSTSTEGSDFANSITVTEIEAR